MHSQEDSNCKTYRDMLYDYVSDNLSEQDRADFLMHINSCPDCKRELNELEAILGAVSEIEEVEVPDSVKSAVSSALAEESLRIRKRKSIYKYVASTVLPIAACTALAIGIYSGGIYDDINNADRMLTEEPLSSQPIETDNASQSPDIISEENAVSENIDKEASQPTPKTSEKPSPKKSSSEKKATAPDNAVAPSAEESTDFDTTPSYQVSEPAESTTSETADADSSAPAEEPVSSSAMAGGGGSGRSAEAESHSAPMLKSRPSSASNSATMEDEHLPAPASEAPLSEDAECYEAEDYTEDTEPTETGYCTVVVSDPSAFAKGFGINAHGNSIIFTISAERWREFVDYCLSNGASVSADFPASKYNSVTITVTKGR